MIPKKELYGFVYDAHKMATEHGWHEEKRTIFDMFALMNSELGEAMEELRKHKDPEHQYRRADGKPEGFAVEIADFCIRIFDFVGLVGRLNANDAKVAAEFVTCYASTFKKLEEIESNLSPTELICLVGNTMFASIHNPDSMLWELGQCIAMSDMWFVRTKTRLPEVIRTKMEFNKTRPMRHGGKLL